LKKVITLLYWLYISHFYAQFYETPSYRNVSKLTLEEIMKGDGFVGYQPQTPFFLPDGNVLFVWQAQSDNEEYTYIWESKRNALRKASDQELDYLPTQQPDWHSSNRHCVYVVNDKIYFWILNQAKPSLVYKSLLPILDIYTVNNPNVIYLLREDVITKIDIRSMYVEDVLIFKESSSTDKKETI
jgi:hypothetical protein